MAGNPIAQVCSQVNICWNSLSTVASSDIYQFYMYIILQTERITWAVSSSLPRKATKRNKASRQRPGHEGVCKWIKQLGI